MFQQADLVETLQGIPWFLELKAEQIEKLAKFARLQQLAEGEELFPEGGKQDCLYIILEGIIDLAMFVPTFGDVHIYTAEPLDIVGWDQFTPVIRARFGSAHASKPCLLIALASEPLRLLCEEDPDLGYVIYRRLTNVVAGRMLNIRLTLTDAIVRLTSED